MLVLHVLDVRGADVAVDHEHDQVGQVLGHLDSADQRVFSLQPHAGHAKVGSRLWSTVFAPLHLVACQLLGRFVQRVVLAHLEPAPWLVFHADFGELRNAVQKAVPRSMQQDLAHQTHVGTDGGHAQRAWLLGQKLQVFIQHRVSN